MEDTSYYEEDQERRSSMEIEQALDVFGREIERKAEEAERDRKPIEDGWVEDLRQLKGLLSAEEQANIEDNDSEIVFNITRNKTEGAYSRIAGMLFQSDKNWGLSPTKNAEIPGFQAQSQIQQQGQPQQSIPPEQSSLSKEEEEQREAEKRAELMSVEIEDQLGECDYENIGRKTIRSACIYGTGIIKGPIIQTKKHKKWRKIADEDGNVARVLEITYEDKPVVEAVPIWNYFPDLSATNREDCSFEIQRHFMTRKKMFGLLERDDFIESQVIRVLKTQPSSTPPSYLSQLRQMAGYSQAIEENQYLVWEYHGPVDVEDLALCGCEVEDSTGLMPEIDAIIWVCQGIVIKASLNPMDTQDRPYSVFCYERDDSCIFGEGVPRLIKNPQSTVSSCWRKINDNSGLAVGPQTVIDDSIIEPVPVNGVISWELTSKKMWRKKNPAKDIRAAFHQFPIDSHLGELQSILTMARQFADEETMLPLIAQGEQASHITQTAHGMEILMNSANDMMRRVVKDWDDNVTIPLITRFYDWNMQFSEREEAKGDMVPEAKGTSALLLKETQAKNMLNFLQIGVNTPLASMTKWKEVGHELAKSMQIDPGKILLSDQELKELQQQSQGKDDIDQLEAAKITIEQQKLELMAAQHQEKMASAEKDRQVKMAVAEYSLREKMIELSAQENLTMAQLENRLKEIEANTISKEHLLAQEAKIAMTKRPEQKGL